MLLVSIAVTLAGRSEVEARQQPRPSDGAGHAFIAEAVNATGNGSQSDQINSAALAEAPTLALVKTVINNDGGASTVSP